MLQAAHSRSRAGNNAPRPAGRPRCRTRRVSPATHAQPNVNHEKFQLVHTPTGPCCATITNSHSTNENDHPSSTRHARHYTLDHRPTRCSEESRAATRARPRRVTSRDLPPSGQSTAAAAVGTATEPPVSSCGRRFSPGGSIKCLGLVAAISAAP
jgi:hypothetical protein